MTDRPKSANTEALLAHAHIEGVDEATWLDVIQRMDEVYSAAYACQGAALGWRALQDLQVGKPETVTLDLTLAPSGTDWLCAGNAFVPYGERLPAAIPRAVSRVVAMPTAQALLRLAPALFQAGLAVPAEQAMPLYVRDKVANTTAEREVLKAEKLAAQQTEQLTAQIAAQAATGNPV